MSYARFSTSRALIGRLLISVSSAPSSFDGDPIKKPTGLMLNSPFVLKSLGRLCRGKFGSCSRAEGGHHRLCNGRAARMAAIFPVRLCKAILNGFRAQLRNDGMVLDGSVGIHESGSGCKRDRMEASTHPCGSPHALDFSDGDYVEAYGQIFKLDNGQGPFYDDLTKQLLPALLVKEARKKEIDYFEMK